MGNTSPRERVNFSSSGEEDCSDKAYNSAHAVKHKYNRHASPNLTHLSRLSHQHLPGVGDAKLAKPKKIPTVFRWSGGGKYVLLAGSFDGWKEKIPMVKSHDDFTTIVELGVGTHEYKYFVDGSWSFNPTEPKVCNEFGSCNNQVTVKESDFEVFEALSIDCADTPAATANLPIGEFSQDIPQKLPIGLGNQRPPTLPPQLLNVVLNKDDPETCEPAILPEPDHVALNHLYALSIKDGVMTLSSTYRYKKKYVTTLLYRPV